jgi:xyloglucan-specific exo-beta-1,4-glucanase
MENALMSQQPRHRRTHVLLITLAASAAGCCPCSGLPPQAAAAQAGTTATNPPITVAKPIPYEWKNVAILGGGFVTGIIFNETEKDLVYARTDIGGAYRLDAASQRWIPITDQLPRSQSNFLGIESLATDPVDPNRVYLAAGTYTQSWAGNGAILRSSDRGQTWEVVELPIKFGGNETGRGNGERLVVDPNAHDVILCGTRKYGMWRSEDAGANWTQYGEFPVKEEPLGVGITFVVFDAKSGHQGKPTPVVYAGFASADHGLYRSHDEGKTWKPVPGQPKGLMPSHGELDGSGALWLSYGNVPGPSDVVDGAVYKYEPAGGRWTNVTPFAPKADDKFGYGGLSVDAKHPGTAMVTTIDRWTHGDEVYRTTNGGQSWTALGEHAVYDDAGAKYLYWGREKPSTSGWMAEIALDPHRPEHAMYVTGQGIWQSLDVKQAEAGRPTHWRFFNDNLEETAVLDIASPSAGPQLLSVMGDICGFRHDDVDRPPPDGMFQNPIFGSGTGIDFAALKPELVVRVGWQDQKQWGALSKDSGTRWTPFATSPEGSLGAGAVAISADGTTILWAPKGAAVSTSTDEGKTWRPCSGLPGPTKLPDWAPVNFRLAADRVNPNKFYVYDASSGKVFSSTDGGSSFMVVTAALPALPEYGLTPAWARSAPGVEGELWITTGKELYRTSDSGKSFRTVDGVSESFGVGFGKAAEGRAFPAVYLNATIGDTSGIFRSDDGGASFARINDDQHQFPSAGVITGDPRRFGRVYLATHGRGILYADPQ